MLLTCFPATLLDARAAAFAGRELRSYSLENSVTMFFPAVLGTARKMLFFEKAKSSVFHVNEQK